MKTRRAMLALSRMLERAWWLLTALVWVIATITQDRATDSIPLVIALAVYLTYVESRNRALERRNRRLSEQLKRELGKPPVITTLSRWPR